MLCLCGAHRTKPKKQPDATQQRIRFALPHNSAVFLLFTAESTAIMLLCFSKQSIICHLERAKRVRDLFTPNHKKAKEISRCARNDKRKEEPKMTKEKTTKRQAQRGLVEKKPA
jgi:hypothetical protein